MRNYQSNNLKLPDRWPKYLIIFNKTYASKDFSLSIINIKQQIKLKFKTKKTEELCVMHGTTQATAAADGEAMAT
jgi:hypothetical protein